MSPDLKKDRTAFLEVVERYAGRATRDAFAVIVRIRTSATVSMFTSLNPLARSVKQNTWQGASACEQESVNSDFFLRVTDDSWQVHHGIGVGAKAVTYFLVIIYGNGSLGPGVLACCLRTEQ
jgi:hypothetical protein